MGRRGIDPGDVNRWVFNRLADDYRWRPGYPDALVLRLVELAGGARRRVVDLGAGTGLLAVPLAERGLSVTAVEPAVRMLRKLREAASALEATLDTAHSAAEHTELPAGAFDLALLADALQWVDPELAGREIERLLRPGGACAVIECSFADTPFMAGMARLLATGNPRARPRSSGARTQLMSLATGGAAVHEQRFAHASAVDESAIDGMLRSLSYVGPALKSGGLRDLIGKAKQLAREHSPASWARDLTLAWSRKPARGRGTRGAPAV